jgi:hypothetical protein
MRAWLKISWPVLAAVVVAGCSSTRIVNQWSNPAYAAPAFKKILVIGVSHQTSVRRSFEDEFVDQLKAAGVDAAPSYRYIQEDGPVDEARLDQAVREAGADAGIITRLTRTEQKTTVSPGYYHPGPVRGFHRWYSSAWAGLYEPPQVYRYEVFVSETSLYDMTKNEVAWSATLQTTGPRDPPKEVRAYVQTVIRALREKKLV